MNTDPDSTLALAVLGRALRDRDTRWFASEDSSRGSFLWWCRFVRWRDADPELVALEIRAKALGLDRENVMALNCCSMPAPSKAMRQAAAIAEHHPGQLYARNKGLLSMTKEQLHDFASTPEKGLPRKLGAGHQRVRNQDSHERKLQYGA